MPRTAAQPDISSAACAVQLGRAALQAGDHFSAVAWLDRAGRLGAKAPSVTLLLASALAASDPERSLRMLSDLFGRYPFFREARLALAAAALNKGDAAGAFTTLSTTLALIAPPADQSFRVLARRIVRLADVVGWAGVDAAGVVTIDLRQTKQHCAFFLADRSIKPARVNDGRWQLPPDWMHSSTLSVTCRGNHVAGSPFDLVSRRMTDGFVQIDRRGDLVGWARIQGDPDTLPRLSAHASHLKRPITIIARGTATQENENGQAVGARHFRVSRARMEGAGELSVRTAAGMSLMGSPLSLAPFPSEASRKSIAVATGRPGPSTVRLAAAQLPARRPIDVIIPVYRGVDDFIACIASVRQNSPASARIIVIDDHSPEIHLVAAVEEAKLAGALAYRHNRNLGYPAAINTGLRISAESGAAHDVVLLNSDTLVPPGWLNRLADVAYADASIGSVTPMTNDGSILSYPRPNVQTQSSLLDDPARVDAWFDRGVASDGAGCVDIPTAVGFCMFIRHDCLAQVGSFRDDVFAQGYAEENDWSLRAHALGWRNVAATGVFVVHTGGRSFGNARSALMRRNLQILNRLHPGYDELVQRFMAADPLASTRRSLDQRRWALRRGIGAVLMVTHALGGGVERFIKSRVEQLRAGGLRPIVMRPVVSSRGEAARSVELDDPGDGCGFPNLRFSLVDEIAELASFLALDRIESIEIHHLIGYHKSVIGALRVLDVPFSVFIHDFAYFCPLIALSGKTGQYCGEPADIKVCESCATDAGRDDWNVDTVASHRQRYAGLLAESHRVIVSGADVGRRVKRFFPATLPEVAPWEDDFDLVRSVKPAPQRWAARSGGASVRVAMAGAIGLIKGFAVLLDCARDAVRRNLPLQFVVVGTTMDDNALLQTGRVFVTGRYDESEAVDLISRQDCDIGWVPSVCPETWCYGLSALWTAGLWVTAFDLGAQRERILRTGKGSLLPLGLPAARLNDALIRIVTGGRAVGCTG